MPTAQRRFLDRQRARNFALRLISVRHRTVTEMFRRLTKSTSLDIAQSVVTELETQGLLNDAAFAAQWRDSRERTRPRSAKLVRLELLQRGVDPDLAGNAVAGMDDEDLVQRAASNYANRLIGLDKNRFQTRLSGYLLRRGFSMSLVYKTLRSYTQIEGEH